MRWWLLATGLLPGCGLILGLGEPALVPADAEIIPADAAPPDAPLHRVILTKTPGGGTVRIGADVVCDEACTETVIDLPGPGQVVFETTLAAGSYFQGWSGGCSGPSRSCTVDVGGEVALAARFSTIDRNLVFVTSATFAGNFGGHDAADGHCASAASSAGLTGGTFVALLSSEGWSTRDYLSMKNDSGGTLGGFIRMDGLPFSDGIQAMANDHRIWYPPLYDERGRVVEGEVWTGSSTEMTWSNNACTDWTVASGNGTVGVTTGGPRTALANGLAPCDQANHLLCVMVSRTTAVDPPDRQVGKLIYLSNNTYMPQGGIEAAHTRCGLDKPAGAGTVKALLARVNGAAADYLDPTALYVRPDGAAVGTGAEIVATSRGEGLLRTGIWQTGAGLYSIQLGGWTGANGGLNAFGDTVSTCSDWTAATSARAGYLRTDQTFWSHVNPLCAGAAYLHLYCVEQ